MIAGPVNSPSRLALPRQIVSPGGVSSILTFQLRGLLLVSVIAVSVSAARGTGNPNHNEATMTRHARGTFEVKVIPQKPDNQQAESANLGRYSLDKQFHGDLEAASTGEMLGVTSEVKGSGAYVALERIRGTLQGRTGSFVLQHNGTMTAGVPQMTVTVAPGSGTGELTGISGTMTIKIEAGKHFYEFDYQIPQ
jgi:Protein of unknown function (DUF3224)